MIFIQDGKKVSNELSDKEVVAKILIEKNKEQIRKYQEVLYHRYAEKVYRKCLGILKNKENAKDLTHDILVKVFSKLDKYGMEAPFNSWILTISYNSCMDFLNKNKKIFYEELNDQKDVAAENKEDEYEELKAIKLAQLKSLMNQLDDGERILLLMRYQDGMSIKEISKLTNLGESAVKMRLKRSRDLLAELLNKLNNE